MCPVLSNKGKRTIYDAGLFGLIGDDEDEVGFLLVSLIFFSDFFPVTHYCTYSSHIGILETGIC